MSYTFGGRFRIPQDIYHSVPDGWSRGEILHAHATMRGSFDLAAPEAVTRSRPAENGWIAYRATLYRLVTGVRAHDHACIELAVRYLERHFIGSYSGFIRAKLARALRYTELSQKQIDRLNQHFLGMVKSVDFTEEFREYRKLWLGILSPESRKALLPIAENHAKDPRWQWLQELLKEKP